MKQWLMFAAVIWLFLVAIVLAVGTAGGIYDNIQFKDWFSVTMWAVFGPTGFALTISGAICLARKLFK